MQCHFRFYNTCQMTSYIHLTFLLISVGHKPIKSIFDKFCLKFLDYNGKTIKHRTMDIVMHFVFNFKIIVAIFMICYKVKVRVGLNL
jgi:hypothetical protein